MPRESGPSKLALAFSVGTLITSNIVGGIFLGYWLDRWLETAPWLIVTGLLLGTVGAFVSLIRVIGRLNRPD